MTRRKNKADAWMPARVYRGKSAFEFHPKVGGAIKLGGLDSKKWEVLKAHTELLATLESKENLAGMISNFFASADFSELSKTTQLDYQKYSRKVIGVFGKVAPNQLEPRHIRAYMDKRGVKSKTQANREKAFLSRAYRWAFERGKVNKNPCTGVRAFTEKPRTRYIEDFEYKAVYDRVPDHVKVAMEISYLCAARKGDVLGMTWDQIKDEGIYIKQGKTNVEQIKEWSPRLRKAIVMAKTLCQDNVYSRWVIAKPNGGNYTGRGFDQGLMDGRAAARLATKMALDFTFHDIKAKSISDFEGSSKEKQIFSGHKTERQVVSYDRKVKTVPTLGSRNK
jgi:integrase